MKLKIRNFLLGLLGVCVFAITGCAGSAVMDSLDMHNIDTGLFTGYKIECDIKGETFTGRAACYGVIVFESQPTDFLQSFVTAKSDGFSSEKNKELEDVIDSFSCFEIPSRYYPDWEAEYMWFICGRLNGLDTLYLIYFPNNLRLVIFETGH